MTGIFHKLTLPNGAVIPNRIAKAAMEENMADIDQAPSNEILRLYQAWADGEVGLIITGNVMIDGRAMTGPGGIILEDEKNLPKFKQWAEAARSKGGHIWLQINHPGRQMYANLGQQAWAPSAVALEMGSLSKLFAVPKALTEEGIQDIIARFARTAQLAEKAGFTGVQIHAAHGYLISQFLSPLSNKREDKWGGSLENRARILIEVIKAVRKVVSPEFCVAVKLNSADFQRGGFSSEDAVKVVEWLNDLPIDLVELSGGSYETPAMQGVSRDGRTLAREAYFLEFATQMTSVAKMPLMVTGGIHRKSVADRVLDSGVDMIGIGTALAINPALAREWREGLNSSPEMPPVNWKNKGYAGAANMARVKYQLKRATKGLGPLINVWPIWALISQQIEMFFRTRQYRSWIAKKN